MKKGGLVKRLEFGAEEFILLGIIILNVLDAFEIIGSDLDYIKKIISWTALGMLIYKASPSKIFVGWRKKSMDGVLLTAYFLMIIKNLISYAYVAVDSASSFLLPFYQFLILHAVTIELVGLYIGLFLILVASFNLSLRTPLLAPSLLHLMRADKVKHNTKTFFLHFFSLVFISLGFFLVFFNLVMEWLAIAIDAPLLMIALVSYFFIIIKHREKFSPGSFLSRFGDFGSNFYKGVMEHLRYKRAFLRVISGLLILHIITDMLTFLWNHLFGIGDPLYLALIGPHPSFLQLVRADLSLSWLTSFIHLGNLVAVIFLMATPLIMWFVLYFNKKIQVTNQTILFLFTCFLIFLLNPTFSFSALKNNIIYGVDITGVFASTYQLIPFAATLLIAIALSLIISNVSSRSIKTILVVAGKVFFVLYVSLYFFSISMYYVKIIPQLLSSLPFTGFIFGIFFLITALFYLVGLGSFLVDTHEHLQEHLSVKA